MRVVTSAAAHRLRIRVGPDGVAVVRPAARACEEALRFVRAHEAWVVEQLGRVERLPGRRPQTQADGTLLFRGVETPVSIEAVPTRARGNHVAYQGGRIVIRCGTHARVPAAQSLERWLRKQARIAITEHLVEVGARLGEPAGRTYIMGQRTKWGGCSARGNLSFNWRLILAPDFVLRYLVAHEAVHLVVPDHSARFWLTLQSLCPSTERARQWLCRHQAELGVELTRVLDPAPALAR